jgi:hypothetical protein
MNELQWRILVALSAEYKANPTSYGTRSDKLMADLGITDEDQYVVALESLIGGDYVEPTLKSQQHPYVKVKITPRGNELVEATPPPKPPKKPLGFVK